MQAFGKALADTEDFFAIKQRFQFFEYVNGLAAQLGLYDHLASGPRRLDDLARQCKMPAEKLERVIAFLEAEEILARTADGLITATSASEVLRKDRAHALITLVSGAMAGSLHQGVTTGVSAYEAHFGKPVFVDFADKPMLASAFGEYMSITTGRLEAQLFSNFRFKPFRLAVDVGGSDGRLLRRVLTDHPESHGILFDLPETADRARALLAASNVADRVSAVGGSFFEAVPPGGDLYLLKQILHDWNDAEVHSILRKVRDAMEQGTRLAVLDRIVPERPIVHDAFGFDIAMMMWSTGRERKLSEFRALLSESGFVIEAVNENPHGVSVIEALAT